jgi:hypothetical protein
MWGITENTHKKMGSVNSTALGNIEEVLGFDAW